MPTTTTTPRTSLLEAVLNIVAPPVEEEKEVETIIVTSNDPNPRSPRFNITDKRVNHYFEYTIFAILTCKYGLL